MNDKTHKFLNFLKSCSLTETEKKILAFHFGNHVGFAVEKDNDQQLILYTGLTDSDSYEGKN